MCAKTGPALELEVLPSVRVLDDDVRADDVGRHQVGRELDPREREVEALRQRPDEQRLAEARDALEQDVPAREERDEHVVDDLVVADDDLVDLLFEPPVTLDEGFYALTGHALPSGRWNRCRAPETWTHYRPAGETGNRFVRRERDASRRS